MIQTGCYLKFYVPQNARHGSRALYEWLLESAQELGLPGGSAFRAAAGYGRHGHLHEDHFFELAGDLPVEVGFVVNETEAAKLLARIETQGLRIFYVKFPVEFGITGMPGKGQS
jgi:PII-like signaling protein